MFLDGTGMGCRYWDWVERNAMPGSEKKVTDVPLQSGRFSCGRVWCGNRDA